jgi:catechol-2,3-dioxygenase
MELCRLPADAHIGYVHLRVADLNRALGFYRDLLGFRQVSQDTPTAILSATGQAPYHISLTERPGARPKPPRTTGLYHVAFRHPNRRAPARTLQRLMENQPIPSTSTACSRKWRAIRLISFALQIPDPEVWGNLLVRLEAAGVSTSEKHDHVYAVSVPVTDPAGNRVELLVEKTRHD